MNKNFIKETTFVGIDATAKIGLQRILSVVCDYFDVSIADVKGKNRQRDFCTARHVYCYLACDRTLERHTLTTIGAEIDRDHASVLHGKKKIANFLDWDSKTNEVINELKTYLGRFSSTDLSTKNITQAHVGFYTTESRK